jgi:hypothetical protein
MLRRALLSLPIVAALALLLGAPAHSAGDGRVSVSATDVGARPASKGALRDDADFLQSQWGDEDDTPDPVVRTRATVVWRPEREPARSPGTAADVRPTHPACACPPRAPPAA